MTVSYMTPGGVGLNDGTSPANAFDWAGFDAWETAVLPGDRLYVGPGTHVGTSSVQAGSDGLIGNRISIIGVSDLNSLAEPIGDARPLFAMNANVHVALDNYWTVRNLRITGDTTIWSFRADDECHLSNLDVTNAGTGYGMRAGGLNGRLDNCRCKATGAAMRGASGTTFTGCIAYESAVGIQSDSGPVDVVSNLVYGCATAIRVNAGGACLILGNTLYNGTTGILDLASTSLATILRNIISGFTTPAEWVAELPSNFWDWNVWHNSGALVNVTKGPNAINENPQFVDPTLGTVEGFRVRNEAVRNLGLTIFPVGAIAPSIFDGGSPVTGGTTEPDLSGDLALRDGLETITLEGSLIPGVDRLPDIVSEQDPTEGVYLSRNVQFDLPVGDAIYPGDSEPTVGMLIVDDDDAAFLIQSVRQPKHSDYWGCMTRESMISSTLGLDNTVTLFPAVDTQSAAGSLIRKHLVPDASFTNVAAKIMLRSSPVGDDWAQRQFEETYDVYVAEEVGQLRAGDVLKDENQKVYEIVSYRNRDRIDELSVIECKLKPR